MVMQRALNFLVGGSNPSEVTMPPPPSPQKECAVRGSNHRPLRLRSAVLPSDRQLYGGILLPHCLEPGQRKLLTPPHPPTPPTPPSKK